MKYLYFLLLIIFLFPAFALSQSIDKLEKYIKQPDEWFKTKEAIRIADNLLLYQHNNGGWIKNIGMTIPLELLSIRKEGIIAQKDSGETTIDNGATYTQLRFLAKVIAFSGKAKRYEAAFYKGLDYLFEAQYDNGGWPQFYPLIKGYYSHITFNDNAMIGVLRLLKNVSEGKKEYHFTADVYREKSRIAVEKGIDCILKTQVKLKDELTIWCAQYDEHNLTPAKARAYELISLSGAESVDITDFLMSIKNPSPQIQQAVHFAVKYLNLVKIYGIKVIEVPEKESPSGKNKIVVEDKKAPPIWARFIEMETGKAMFVDRDGVVKYNLSEIGTERRNHYNWLDYWPQELLNKKYPAWLKKNKLKSVLH